MVQPRLLSHVILLLSSVVGYCGDRISHESPLDRLRLSNRGDTHRVQSDVEIRHGDQTRHGDMGGETHDQNGLQVAAAAALAASLEEGLLGVWMQK